MTYTEDEAKKLIFESILGKALIRSVMESGRFDFETLENLGFAEVIYKPTQLLKNKIEEYKLLVSEDKESDGRLLEQIAFLAFLSLGHNLEIESYQSIAPQLDLVVTNTEGPFSAWGFLMEYLPGKLPKSGTLLVEAKDITAHVSFAQFARLCSILQTQFDQTCYLAIFFSRKGATGFPRRGNQKRQRVIKDALAAQVIFHAKTGKYIVVFDAEDIFALAEDGALPRILRKKVSEVEKLTGLAELISQTVETVNQSPLPPHLQECLALSQLSHDDSGSRLQSEN